MSASGDPSNDRDQLHRGHDLEAGVLQRVREWTDVFPWVRLGRVMRVAGSPPLLLIVAIVLAVWASSLSWLDSDTASGAGLPVDVGEERSELVIVVVQALEAIWGPPGVGWPGRLWRIVWSLILWTPVALLLIRQGALLCAGRDMSGLAGGVTGAIRRTPAAWWAALLPTVAVVVVGLPILLVGWLQRFAGGLALWEAPAAVLVALVAVACGLLGFGALAAVPLSWAAIANEPAADPLDSLSRGYEYLCRRPLQLVFYLVIALVLVLILWALAWGVAWAGGGIADRLLHTGRLAAGMEPAPGGGVADVAVWLVHFLPIIAVTALSWGLVGGVYLLLRRDAGGQEVEDIWQPPTRVEPPLPPLEGA